jgi:hypothetical protein
MSEIAFFPWFHIEDPIQIGQFELLKYNSDSAFKIQNDLNNIIGQFYTYEERKVNNCVILKIEGKELGVDFNEDERRRIFLFSELLTFSGLSARNFFMPLYGGYSNKDVYQIIIRRYEQSDGGYSIQNRRRDGTTNTIVVDKATKIRRPQHIQSFFKIPIDFNLLSSMLNGSESIDDKIWKGIYESIINFNLANTDRQEIREELEINLLFSSFERLFNVGKNQKQLFSIFNEIISPSNSIKPEMCERIKKIQNNRYKNTKSLRELWLKDLNKLRDNLAHGKFDNNYPSVWSLHEHLLYSSFILPICMKIILTHQNLYTLTEADIEGIELFEKYLSIYPFEVSEEKVPWVDLIGEHRIKKLIRRDLDS